MDEATPASHESRQQTDFADLNLAAVPIKAEDVERTRADLQANPPAKFDLARKLTVFNSAIEFVDFKLHGAAISRKTVPIRAELMGFAKQPDVQALIRSSSRLLADDSGQLSADHIFKLKQSIAGRYLVQLPKHGIVILRSNKAEFQAAVQALKFEVQLFQDQYKARIQAVIEANREKLVAGLLAGVLASPPERWQRFIGSRPSEVQVESMLRSELTKAFGSAADVLRDMEVVVVFKGVTHESLTDPAFVAAIEKILPPELRPFHEEFEAVPAQFGGAK